MKISGCWQTIETAKRWAQINTYIATIRAWGYSAADALRAALLGQPILSPTP